MKNKKKKKAPKVWLLSIFVETAIFIPLIYYVFTTYTNETIIRFGVWVVKMFMCIIYYLICMYISLAGYTLSKRDLEDEEEEETED